MRNLLTLVLLIVALAMAPAARADGPPVVLIIQLEGPVGAGVLPDLVRKGNAIQEKLNPESTVRLFFDLYHGPGFGRYTIAVEFPDLEYFAAAMRRNDESAEWQRHVQDVFNSPYEIIHYGLSREIL